MSIRIGSCLGCGQHCCSLIGLPWTPYTQVMGSQLISRLPLKNIPYERVIAQNWSDYRKWLSYHNIDSYWEGDTLSDGSPTSTTTLVVSAPKDGVLLDPAGRVVPQVFGGKQALILLSLRCKFLQDDGSCGVYGTPERPDICAEWPSQPWELQTLDEAGQAACGYSFIPTKPGGTNRWPSQASV